MRDAGSRSNPPKRHFWALRTVEMQTCLLARSEPLTRVYCRNNNLLSDITTFLSIFSSSATTQVVRRWAADADTEVHQLHRLGPDWSLPPLPRLGRLGVARLMSFNLGLCHVVVASNRGTFPSQNGLVDPPPPPPRAPSNPLKPCTPALMVTSAPLCYVTATTTPKKLTPPPPPLPSDPGPGLCRA